MRTIKLKSLSLVNFKGIRNLTLNFSDKETLVCGENGTGKTTVFDAFLWLLFGKDSTGRSDSNFNIKTLDDKGMPILHLEHSVTGILNINGMDVKLQRNYVEVWVKPRGTTEETLKNHATEFYLNDVKLSTKKEYDSEVSAIISEDVFRMITNPFYFPSLKPEAQKEILLDIVGTVTDQEVANLNPEYSNLLAQLSGRTIAQYAKEVSAKKKACKDELAVIPSQIETAQKLMPEEEDWVAIDSEIAHKNARIQKIEEQITDKSKLNEQEYQRKANIQKQIGEKRLQLTNRENAIHAEANKGRNEASLKLNRLEYALRGETDNLNRKKSVVASLDRDMEAINTKLSALRGEFASITTEELTYNEGEFICPTCKRPLDIEDIEAKQKEMQSNFNANKAARLKANKEAGMAKKQRLEEMQASKDRTNAEIVELEQKIERINADIQQAKASIPEVQNVEAMVTSDQTCIDIKNEIVELENQLKVDAKIVDVSELQSEKRALNEAIQALYKRSANREQIGRAEKEIASLEEKRIANNQKLADLEKWEFTALQFQKDKDAELLKRINGLFSYVSFSFVDAQLNGGEKLTCVCTVNGTPFPDVNNAGRVNAGIDIINAICNAKGVSAPIFLDNRESVNNIIPTVSQIINLCVSGDKSLTIK
jgi:DNA repair exonuclease SbcCD ATPase subunit